MAVETLIEARKDLPGTWQVSFLENGVGHAFLVESAPTPAVISDLAKVAREQVALQHQAAAACVLPPEMVGSPDTFVAGLSAAASFIRHFAGRLPEGPQSAGLAAAFSVLATEVEALPHQTMALAGRFDIRAAGVASMSADDMGKVSDAA